ncbi:MAG: aminopeptidase [Velocimicrobium sp.]
MNYQMVVKEENEAVLERYELSMERILLIATEETRIELPYRDYFLRVAGFFMKIKAVCDLAQNDKLTAATLEQLRELNQKMYADIIEESYKTSYANPTYAVKMLGKEMGQILSFLYTEIRGSIAYAYENRLFDITIAAELFIEIYNIMEEKEDVYKSVKSAIYYYVSDYSDVTVTKRIRELLDPDLSFAVDIIMNQDLEDLRYLYLFGEYISDNEIKIAEYLNSLTQEMIDSMASTYTEGFRLGFENYRIDLSKKSVVNIHYPVGFERMVKAAIKQFEVMGLKTSIYRAAVSSIHKKQHLKIGFHSKSANKQYDYDHRFDQAIFLDKALNERKLAVSKVSLESMKEMAAQYAGPAVIEVFGDVPFLPKNKEEALMFSQKQQKLSLEYQKDYGILSNQYMKNDEISFTIISYPIPEIGNQFEDIFHETVRVNTLDMDLYERIQKNIIDVLDQGDYVTVTGRGENRTNLSIQLSNLLNPEKETNFENCLADVNIPVGEVFTSPKLTGTNGVLHVTKVYLRDLNFIDLELIFQDGKIKQYTCKNFENEEENQKFVKENVMYQHDSLPMGEFAIGTNTTAYAMGEKYGISPLLPILIAEKTGPHFAVGDTCFRMSEDMRTYNPDGKEMKAKDNECSILRKTNIDEAYFGCHTDITIPYHELGDIIVHKPNGDTIVIIKQGRFVLEGTEELNIALDELNELNQS